MAIEAEQFLEHFGVKGMKWGVRKERSTGVSRKTDKAAREDAQEMARAKMYYGKGAGTRRKLIKAKVESQKAKDPDYAKAFDHHLSNQDLGQHASKATKERTKTDRREKNKQRGAAIARRTTGEMGTQAALVAVAAVGVAYMRSPQGQAMMKKGANVATKTATNAMNNRSNAKMAANLSDFFKANGVM